MWQPDQVAGRRKRRKARSKGALGIRGTSPDSLTTDQYCQAWELFAAGTTAKQIRQIVGLTGAQFFHLYREGLPARGGRRTPLVGFEQRLVEEQAAIRSEAVEAGKAVSRIGVKVLAGAMDNSNTAQVMTRAILLMLAEEMEHQLSLPVEKRSPLKALLPDQHTLQVLRAMDKLGSRYKDAATTYRLIYDDPVAVHPATRGSLDLAGRGAGRPGQPAAARDSLPAALAFQDGALGDGAATALLEDMAKVLQRWTPEQRKHYAETGEEPDPSDVIDVTAT